MNYPALALGFAFSAIALAFRSNARREADPARARNVRFASTLFFIASAAFLFAAAISFFGD